MKTIRSKIVMTLFLLITLVISAQAVRFYMGETELFIRQAEVFRSKAAQDWAINCERSYGNHQYGVDQSFSGTHNSRMLVTAACYTKDGKAFRALSPEKLEQSLLPPEKELMRRLFSGRYTPSDTYTQGAEMIVINTPVNVFPDGKVLSRIYFSKTRELEEQNRQRRRVGMKIYGISAIVLIAAYIAILLISSLFVRPIDDITRGAREIARGNLKYRIGLNRNDELGQIARELNEMAEKLSELEKLKDDFTSGITHDLRSPVTGIKLAAGNIIKEYRTGKVNRIPEQVFIIEENTERLNRLIDMILQVSKIESGNESLSLSSVNAEELLDGIVQANRPYAKEKNLVLDLIIETGTSDIVADREKLEQALSNIITNSLKYTDAGTVFVYICQADSGLQIRVKDTGRGIEPELRKYLFEKFQKGAHQGKGSGLGLYIAKKIIELHGGKVDFVSEPGKGTEFTVTLPVAQAGGSD
ncbi:MAG: HAMP domain-containing sensor histidine kinase [Elusimicrobiaceae bacterium]|nr:HAMP domain-containing sensor histidine kinase [Elusimicrobiaceae bacterium]